MSILKTIAPRVKAELLLATVEGSDKMPVDLQQAKDYARSDESFIIDSLISGSVEAFQAYTSHLMFHQQVTAEYMPKQYKSILYAPWLPIVEIESVEDEYGEIDYTLRGDYIEVDTTKKVTVVYKAGLFEDNANQDIQLGCLKWIVSNLEDRQDFAGIGVHSLPNGSKSHWRKYKSMSI